jgi:hypothetical protein
LLLSPYPGGSRLRLINLRLLTLLFTLSALTASAQVPTIGTIDFYGLRKLQEKNIRKVIGFAEGSPLPRSKGDVEIQIEEIKGIVHARLEAACCDANRQAILYIGVEEVGAPHFSYRVPPETDLHLPEEVASAYRRFLKAVSQAGQAGTAQEDLSRGHSLMADPEVRAVQMEFTELAEAHLPALQKVLRESADNDQRAIAAYVIGYAKVKARVVNDLQFALQDPDDTVRNNALRSLAAFAVLATTDPKSEVRMQPTWFVEMLHSLVWSDRNNAIVTLVTLTESRSPIVLDLLRERALPELIEMAAWKHLPHALPAYIVLGRVLGYPEQELQDLWSQEKRSVVIEKARSTAKKKR